MSRSGAEVSSPDFQQTDLKNQSLQPGAGGVAGIVPYVCWMRWFLTVWFTEDSTEVAYPEETGGNLAVLPSDTSFMERKAKWLLASLKLPSLVLC